mgnify:CR=1 FL=1
MPTVKTIKDVDEKSWLEFKSMAAKRNIKMGKLFEQMIEEHKDRGREFWNKILNAGKILSDKEAEDMERFVDELRKEKGFRY